MLSWEMRSYRLAEREPGRVFFDRGVPDVIGYLRLSDLPITPHIERAAELFRYNGTVFIAPPWPDIFGEDAERKQTWDEAERTYHAMIEAYFASGYELVHLPFAPGEERARFIVARV